jgi:hypothetical protein
MNTKPRVVKDYEKLSEEILNSLKLEYPRGFEKHLIRFKNKEGKYVSALPYETEDRYYLIRMTLTQAQEIIEEDDDYDEDGNLSDSATERLEDLNEMPDDSEE